MRDRPSAISSAKVRLSRLGSGRGKSGFSECHGQLVLTRGYEFVGLDRDGIAENLIADAEGDVDDVIDAIGRLEQGGDLAQIDGLAELPAATVGAGDGMQEAIETLQEAGLDARGLIGGLG